MGWSKLDDAVFGHHKFLAAGPDGVTMWMMALAYANRYSTDGFIPDVTVPALYPLRHPAKVAQQLVTVGLFERVEGGFVVHDYLDYNPSAIEVKERREAERLRKQAQRSAGASASDRGTNGRYVSQELSHRDTDRTPGGVPPGVPVVVAEVSSATRPVPSRPSQNPSQSNSDLRPPKQPPDEDDEDDGASLWTDLAQGDLAMAVGRGEVINKPAAYVAKVAADRRRRGDRNPQVVSKPKPSPAHGDDLAAAAKANREHAELQRFMGPEDPAWADDPERTATNLAGVAAARNGLIKRAP